MITHKTITSMAAIHVLLAGSVSIGHAENESPALRGQQQNAPVLIAQANPSKPVSAAKAALAARKLAQDEQIPPADAAPFEDGAALVLNLKPLYRLVFATLSGDHARYANFLGRQVVDGVPLLIEGNVVLYGQMMAERATGNNRHNPHLIRGVRVGRAFDELHLVHTAAWEDFEGSPIAIITLHYHDGSTSDLPIIYGGHVRGGLRLLTEENETLTDADSKVIWRGAGPGSEELHAIDRLFKSTLVNPQPEKVVDTLDLRSAGEPLASYSLVAATVTLRDPNRALTQLPPSEAPRNFAGRLAVHVTEAASHHPVSNAEIIPALKVDGIYLIGAALLTSAQGEATVRYPTTSTTEISLRARKGSSVSPAVAWQPGVSQVTLEISEETK